MSITNLPTLVLIDDSEDDLMLSMKSIARENLQCHIDANRDGEEAVVRLTKPNSELPSLIIVDYNMPGVNGLEVLQQLRSHERTRCVPVVIFSGTLESECLRKCYSVGLNSWVAKPTDPVEYGDKVSALAHYWLKVNRYCSNLSC